MTIQRADPQQRRRALLVMLVVCAVLLLGLPWLQGLPDWLETDEPALALERLRLLTGVVGLLALPVLIACYQLWRIAERSLAEQRFPPASARLLRDTRVVTGRAAVVRVRLLQGLTILIAALVIVFPAVLWWIISTLAGKV